ncbi:hypothetical protein [Sphingomonas sp. GC_Shp_3]|uniref:hypothetical protein n=1 Tax=Sphingomonas sp. GC_Shp_3 TaxID=2937383 RepID=UPI002269FA20|nr:hypothetical protein [Sphingomonas sp. GC_Shp_3]
MSAWIIPFPGDRVHRSRDLIDTLAKLEMCDEYEASDNPAKRSVAPSMRAYWEGKFAELGGVPAHLLKHDVPDKENA